MPKPRTSREDIVVTGVACRFAESPNPEAFWQNILQRRALFTPLPERAACPGIVRKNIFDRPYPTHAAQLNDLYACNPADQYFPRTLNEGENQDVYFTVQLVMDALRDSGGTVNSLPTDRVSLRMGYMPLFNTAAVNWMQQTIFLDQTMDIIQKFFPNAGPNQLEDIHVQLGASLPKPNPYAFMSVFGCSMAAWTADLLGFAGPATVLEAGGISTHQAIQLAMDDLLSRRSDIAIAGAVQPPISVPLLQGLSGALTFSSAKTLQPFGRESTGTLPGEGGAMFVLKRLKDAVRQNDRIYAIIRSTSAVAVSLEQQQRVLAPQRMARAIQQTLDAAALSADAITYVEAHGCGIPYVDQEELQVLQEVFGASSAHHPLVGIGAVKGNVGHTLWASGAASFLKAVLAIYHRVLPPNVEIEKPLVRLASPKSRLYLLSEARPWMGGGRRFLRRAGVSGVDFTGSCAAAVLEEFPGGSV